jgi:hypothetical protein
MEKAWNIARDGDMQPMRAFIDHLMDAHAAMTVRP